MTIARQECQKRGWPWREPVSVKWGIFSYTVWGGGTKGGNLCIKIRKSNGEIMNAGFSPM